MLTASSNIMFYRLEKKVAVLDKMIYLKDLKDNEGNALIYKIVAIEIASTEVP
jgi:hypothetical protein